MSHLLVTAQFAGLLIALTGTVAELVWGPGDRPRRLGPVSPWLELALGAAGIGLAAVAGWHNRPSNFSVFPEIKANARLITAGPYRYIRHPMYTALILIAVAAAIYGGHYLNFCGLGLMVLALAGKTAKEEVAMALEFAEFEDYRRRTTRFLPYIF